jgi:hypothetical protein
MSAVEVTARDEIAELSRIWGAAAVRDAAERRWYVRWAAMRAMRAFERICGDERRVFTIAKMFFPSGIWFDSMTRIEGRVSRLTRSGEPWRSWYLTIKDGSQSRDILLWGIAVQLLRATGFNDVNARSFIIEAATKEVQRRLDALAVPIGPLPKKLEPKRLEVCVTMSPERQDCRPAGWQQCYAWHPCHAA